MQRYDREEETVRQAFSAMGESELSEAAPCNLHFVTYKMLCLFAETLTA
jgi:hypothetical protein